jgi:hypothetical protein
MARKSRRNKSARKPPKKSTGPTARQILARAKLGRVEQHVVFKELIKTHQGRIPIYALIEHRAIRLEEAISG